MTRPPRLLLIDPSVQYPEEECVETLVRAWPGEGVVLRPALRPGDGPGPGFGYDAEGVAILGSRASVEDDLVWLRGLEAWIDPILDGSRPMPLLGICFGHQLVAKRAGGAVGLVHEDGAPILGVVETSLEDSRLAPGASRMRVVASHREHVTRPAPGYRVVARRAHVPADGLEHQRLPIFTFQFHPEARAGFLETRGLDPLRLTEEMIDRWDRLILAFHRVALSARAAPG